jgi:hypothetical protein
MHDMAEQHGLAMPTETKKGKTPKCYPSIGVDEKQLPELKGYAVGDKVELVINADIVEIRKKEKEGLSFRIELRECGISGKIQKYKNIGESFQDVINKTSKASKERKDKE